MTTPQLNIDEQLACYRLLLEGKWKEVQVWSEHFQKWLDKANDSFCHNIKPFSVELLRRKPAPPQPKYRPWKDAGEVPLGAWLKVNNVNGKYQYLLVSKNEESFFLVNGCGKVNEITFSEGFRLYVHSIDQGRNWLPCGVEVKE